MRLPLLAFAVAAAAFAALTARAQTAQPRTVSDYFLLVPERYVGYDLGFRKGLLKGGAGAVVDVKNGYISYEASDNLERFEFAVFKRRDGKYVVAYSVPYEPDFEEGRSAFLLLTYENGKWNDVTKKLLPAPFDGRLSYKLPRQGREVLVVDEGGRLKYTLTWKDDKFLLAEP